MTNTETSQQAADQVAETRATTPRWFFVVAVAVVALLAGAAGAAVSHLAFPAEAGHIGPTGQPGPAGPVGADGAAASLDTNKVGYCFDSSYRYNGDVSWIDSVSLYTPTSTNGTLSCPAGSFISLTPTGPNGRPIKNYDASEHQ